jgi:hypothetical protein
MATIEYERGYGDGPARRGLTPAVRWGAVVAGVAVGIAVQLALTLLGVASGLSSLDIAGGNGASIGRGALIWAGISMLIASLVGGYVAARMTGLKRKADGVLHGVVTWSVTTMLFATLASSATGSMLGTMFSTINPQRAASSVISGQAAASAGRMAEAIRSQTGVNVSPENLRMLEQYVANGQRDQAVQYMISNMGVEQGRAAAIVDQALIVSGKPAQASPQGQAQANQALDRAGMAAWTVFGAVALSLVLGILGGLLGSLGARRTTWSESGGPVAVSSAGPASATPNPANPAGRDIA